MSKKLQALFGLLIVLSMVLSACGAPAAEPVAEVEAPAAEATEAPAVATEAPVVETGPDAQALFDELVNSLPADKGYGTVKADKFNEELVDKTPFILDVREAGEIEAAGFIEGSVNIPVRDVLNNLDKLPALDEPIVVTCASGHRGGFVMAALKLLGYTNVRSLTGGLNAWIKAEYPVVTGSMPEAPAVLNSAAIIEDQTLFEMLNGFMTELPEGFYAIKNDKLSEEMVDKAPILIDIRTTAEWDKEGYIEGAVILPMQELFSNLDKLPAKNERFIIYCAGGHRGSIVVMGLHLLGYENVINLNGGFNGWKAAGLPVVGLTSDMAEFLATLPSDAGFYSIKTDKLNEMLVENPPFIVDVREASEIEANGFIAGAVNIPIRDLLKNLDKLPAQDQKIVITCASGHRGALGMMALRLLGYTDVVNLVGGMNGWIKSEFAVESGTPAAPAAGTAPAVDEGKFAALDAYLSGLPEGFGAVKPADFNTELAGGEVPFILDVRGQTEWDENGHIDGAVLVPVIELPANLAQLPADKAAPILVTCASGHRGAMAQMYLQFLGYTSVRNLNGGMNGWIAAELPVVK